MLAKLRPDAEELSLCFDRTCEAIGEFDEGEALFDGTEPSETSPATSCRSTRRSNRRAMKTRRSCPNCAKPTCCATAKSSIQPQGAEQPFVYRGFRMIDEQKLSELRGDQLRKMNQSGMLPLIYAHLFSLSLMTQIFTMQVAAGQDAGAGTRGGLTALADV